MISRTRFIPLVSLAVLGACGGDDDLPASSLPIAERALLTDLPGCGAVRLSAVRYDLWSHPDAPELVVVSAHNRGVCIDSVGGLKAVLSATALDSSSSASMVLCVANGSCSNPVNDDPIPPSGPTRPMFNPFGDDPIPPSMPGGPRPVYNPLGDDPIPPSRPGALQPYDPAGDDPIPPSRPPDVVSPAPSYRLPSYLRDKIVDMGEVNKIDSVSQ